MYFSVRKIQFLIDKEESFMRIQWFEEEKKNEFEKEKHCLKESKKTRNKDLCNKNIPSIKFHNYWYNLHIYIYVKR